MLGGLDRGYKRKIGDSIRSVLVIVACWVTRPLLGWEYQAKVTLGARLRSQSQGETRWGQESLKNDVLPTTYLGGDWELSTGSLHWRPLRSHDGIVSMGQRVRLEWAETQEWSQGAQAKLLTRLWCSRERGGRYRRKEVG